MRDNHKMYGRSSPHKQNMSRHKEEIQVSIQRLLPLLVYPVYAAVWVITICYEVVSYKYSATK